MSKLKKILIIDDEPDVLELTSIRLRNNGYEVLALAEGLKVLDFAEKNLPDLILLDVRLPDINGFDLAKNIKNSEKLKGIPLVLISADSHARVSQNEGTKYIDDILLKPFNSLELLAKLDKHLKNH